MSRYSAEALEKAIVKYPDTYAFWDTDCDVGNALVAYNLILEAAKLTLARQRGSAPVVCKTSTAESREMERIERLKREINDKIDEEICPENEITGAMWSAGRATFRNYAGQYMDAKTDEGASVIADIAPAEIYKNIRRAALRQPLAEEKSAPVVEDDDYPAGAMENGAVFIDKLEQHYDFKCEAGSLSECAEWDDLKRCFRYMADYIQGNSEALRRGIEVDVDIVEKLCNEAVKFAFQLDEPVRKRKEASDYLCDFIRHCAAWQIFRQSPPPTETPEIDAEREEIIEEIDDNIQSLKEFELEMMDWPVTMDDLQKLHRAVTQPPAQEAVPAAWRVTHLTGRRDAYTDLESAQCRVKAYGGVIEPLYTTPAQEAGMVEILNFIRAVRDANTQPSYSSCGIALHDVCRRFDAVIEIVRGANNVRD